MEIEVNEQVQNMQENVTEVVEELKEELHHQQEQQAKDSVWVNKVAICTGIFAAFAAIAALQANFLGEEGMVAQIKAADQWSVYQAKSTKEHIQSSAGAILQSLGKPIPASINQKSTQLEQDKTKIYAEAKGLEKESHTFFERHQTMAYSVTALQVAISLSAIAVLLRRKVLWYTGIGLALFGIGFMVMGNLPVSDVASESVPENASSVTSPQPILKH